MVTINEPTICNTVTLDSAGVSLTNLSVNDTLAPIYNAYFVAQSDNNICMRFSRAI